MGEVRDQSTIGEVWADAVRQHRERPFLVVPANAARSYLPDGLELTYGQANAGIEQLIEAYARAGYGVGHRVAMLLENRPEHVLHKLALNIIGVSVVPINPDYRAGEIAYLVDHSEPELILVVKARARQIAAGLAESRLQPPVQVLEDAGAPPAPLRVAETGPPVSASEASILYTSGTTGRPKGCMLSHGYELTVADWYASRPGLAILHPGVERIYNPLPLYHINSGVVSLFGAMLTGGCQIQPDRFHPERWWREVTETRASIVHYLGVVIPMLLAQPASAADRGNGVRFGFGAGVEPTLHAPFEARFGFPLIELWGMTETVRVLSDSVEPRQVGTRAFGRAEPGVEVRVVDETDRDVPDGTPGEMLVRHSAATPRRGAFSGYLKDAAETERAWRGGWFHTGDTVTRAADGMLHFVDRKKNIIRRSGENIAAAEIEATLLTHPDVLQVAVLAVKDEVREEEVLACVVLKAREGEVLKAREGEALKAREGEALKAREGDAPKADEAERSMAEALFRHCNDRLAYYKAPGWIWFTRELPTTGTQKIQKHVIFPGLDDPRRAPGMLDFRDQKKRT